MAAVTFGRLTEAWTGEASDFTPLLAEQLGPLGDAIGVDFAASGRTEVPTAGGRRIDIVAQSDVGAEFVIENQYGRADHDHLTRGLAYAVARHARGLVVVAEEHRDEFRAVAQYLNELAEHDQERGVAVWLVEATAIRIGDSPWAALFTAVVAPNAFTTTVEQAKKAESPATLDTFLGSVSDDTTRASIQSIVSRWVESGRRFRMYLSMVALEAPGPAAGGYRTVIGLSGDGSASVPFNSYAGSNSGIPVAGLTTPEFRSSANALFGFTGTEKWGRTTPGWLTPDRLEALFQFCERVAAAYAETLATAEPAS